MKCVILCAGYATRLYPLTLNTPKPLLQIGKKKVVEFIIDKLQNIPEIGEIYVVTNQKFYPHFVQWKNSCPSIKPIKIINDGTTSNEDRLGAIGDIAFVVRKENIDDELLVIAGDNLFQFEIADFTSFFNEKKSTSIAVCSVEDANEVKKMGVVEMDGDSRIIGFEEKPQNPKTSIVSTACYLFSREDVKELLGTKSFDRSGDFVSYLSKKKAVYGFSISGHWFDIGSFEQLKEARRIFT